MIDRKVVLLITDIPNPYRIPLFNELNRQLMDLGYDFKVLFGARGLSRRLWQINMEECRFAYQVLPTRDIRFKDPEKSMYTYSRLYQTIREARPAVVITNGFSIATTKLWFRSLVSSLPYVIWSGAVDRVDAPEPLLRTWHRKVVVRRASGFIAYGTWAKEYLIQLGADPQRIVIGINTVDTAFFAQRTAALRKREASRDGLSHLLYVGYLTPRKNVLEVLKAVKLLSRSRSDFVLDIVGEGTDMAHLRQYVQENGLAERVQFHGFRQKQELPEFFAGSVCFLFQTDFDIWGLVLVEAMASGLPSISSINAGATHDLITEGVTGFTVNFSDNDRVVERINWVLNHGEEAKRIGENAKKRVIEHVDIVTSARGFVRAVEQVIGESHADA